MSEIKATAHIKSDRSEIRIEVWSWDDKVGVPPELAATLISRGYINTGDAIHGYRLTTEPTHGKTEMAWLIEIGIELGTGGFYE